METIHSLAMKLFFKDSQNIGLINEAKEQFDMEQEVSRFLKWKKFFSTRKIYE